MSSCQQAMDTETKAVLVLGAGLVSVPCVDYLLRNGFPVTVATAYQGDLDKIRKVCPKAAVKWLDVVSDGPGLEELIKCHAIVISLIPAGLHSIVASVCIANQKSVVIPSYLDDNIKALDQRAKDARVTVLAECGLDPGIDHMLAKSCIDGVREQGGKIDSFVSLCGGLPAPSSSDGPLHYKFSWSPQGMFLSSIAGAKYLEDRNIQEISSVHIFDKPVHAKGICDVELNLEFIPNRNALVYQSLYDIQGVNKIYRGTLRYQGFSRVMRQIVALGLLSQSPIRDDLPGLDVQSLHWRDVVSSRLGVLSSSSAETVSDKLLDFAKGDTFVVETFQKLGFLGEETLPKAETLFDAVCLFLGGKLQYGAGDEDMIVMQTEVECTLPGGRRERHTMDLMETSVMGPYSAMAKTVGFPAAMAAILILNGQVESHGVIIPVTSDVYRPILSGLADQGIKVKSSVITIN